MFFLEHAPCCRFKGVGLNRGGAKETGRHENPYPLAGVEGKPRFSIKSDEKVSCFKVFCVWAFSGGVGGGIQGG